MENLHCRKFVRKVPKMQSSVGREFLIYYLKAIDLKKAQDEMLKSEHPIDIYHRRVMNEVTESVEVLNLLVDLD